jgi:hypothetical protein
MPSEAVHTPTCECSVCSGKRTPQGIDPKRKPAAVSGYPGIESNPKEHGLVKSQGRGL